MLEFTTGQLIFNLLTSKFEVAHRDFVARKEEYRHATRAELDSFEEFLEIFNKGK